MSAPTKMSEPPIASTRPWVSTARSSVVSEPTRETRSPVRRASNSRIGRRSMRRDEPAAAREHDALAGALQEVVLEPADEAGDDDEHDERPDERAEVEPGLHAR